MSVHKHLPESMKDPNRARREFYVRKFNIPVKKVRKLYRLFDLDFLNQLDGCADNMARRILLGVSR